MSGPTGNTPPRPNRRPAAQGTVYRSQTATAPAKQPAAGQPTVDRPAGSPSPASRPGRGPGRRWFAVVALMVVGAVTAVLGVYHLTATATPAQAAPADAGPTATGAASATGKASGPLLKPGPVNVPVDGFMSWALMDRKTGAITGSANDATATSTTESMIKAWISSDYLRLQAAAGNRPSQQRLDELTTMIRDSDDQAAEDIYRLDGGDAVVNRMISICGLTGTTMVDGWWSKTQITAADATRLGLCVADGRAAGPTWTAWILDQMRQVRGEGRFGVIDALPADVARTTAIKNGWTLIYADGTWHVACLAVQNQWILSVLTRYDGSRGLTYGANVCADVTRQLMTGRS